LAEACGKTGWEVQALCLMGNHFHLVVEDPAGAGRATTAGDGDDGKMDRRTAADGNGRICESLVISTSEGGQTHHMTISRTLQLQGNYIKVKASSSLFKTQNI
jgi:hypothetical protein